MAGRGGPEWPGQALRLKGRRGGFAPLRLCVLIFGGGVAATSKKDYVLLTDKQKGYYSEKEVIFIRCHGVNL